MLTKHSGVLTWSLLVLAVLFLASLWRIFTKAGQRGWAALVPGYNLYLLCRIAGTPGWWAILLLIPGINVVVWIVLNADLAERFEKRPAFGFGLFSLPVIFYSAIAFSKANYREQTLD